MLSDYIFNLACEAELNADISMQAGTSSWGAFGRWTKKKKRKAKKIKKKKYFCRTLKTSLGLKEEQNSAVAWSVIIIGRTEPINAKWLMWELVPTRGREILFADIIKPKLWATWRFSTIEGNP